MQSRPIDSRIVDLLADLKALTPRLAIDYLASLIGDKASRRPEVSNTALVHTDPHIYHVGLGILWVLDKRSNLFLVDLNDRDKLVCLAECVPTSKLMSAAKRVDITVCILLRHQPPSWFKKQPPPVTSMTQLAPRFAAIFKSLPTNAVILDVAMIAEDQDLIDFVKDFLELPLSVLLHREESKQAESGRSSLVNEVVLSTEHAAVLSKLVGNVLAVQQSSGQLSSEECKSASKGVLTPLLELKPAAASPSKTTSSCASITTQAGESSVTVSSTVRGNSTAAVKQVF